MTVQFGSQLSYFSPLTSYVIVNCPFSIVNCMCAAPTELGSLSKSNTTKLSLLWSYLLRTTYSLLLTSYYLLLLLFSSSPLHLSLLPSLCRSYGAWFFIKIKYYKAFAPTQLLTVYSLPLTSYHFTSFILLTTFPICKLPDVFRLSNKM